MKFDHNTPIYIQVMDMIKKQIVSNELKSGDRLPSVRELAVRLKVNPNTIQRTYQELERDGITETQRGLGRYVTDNRQRTQLLKDEMCQDIIQNFIHEMRALGFSDDRIAKIISKNLGEVD